MSALACRAGESCGEVDRVVGGSGPLDALFAPRSIRNQRK
jgi:hypothetical protein